LGLNALRICHSRRQGRSIAIADESLREYFAIRAVEQKTKYTPIFSSIYRVVEAIGAVVGAIVGVGGVVVQLGT